MEVFKSLPEGTLTEIIDGKTVYVTIGKYKSPKTQPKDNGRV